MTDPARRKPEGGAMTLSRSIIPAHAASGLQTAGMKGASR
jgi:hypothetical protein